MAYDCDVLYLSFTLPPSASGSPTVIVLIIILVILYPGIARYPFPKDFEQIEDSNL